MGPVLNRITPAAPRRSPGSVHAQLTRQLDLFAPAMRSDARAGAAAAPRREPLSRPHGAARQDETGREAVAPIPG